MLGLVLSILLVVLVSGAVLWVVDGEHGKPTSAPPDAPSDRTVVALATIPDRPATPARPRQPATSRRVAPRPSEPAPEPEWRDAPLPPKERTGPSTVAPLALLPPVRTLDPPLPRHRMRSAILLVALIVAVGALLAAVIGVVVSALAFALRAAVTS